MQGEWEKDVESAIDSELNARTGLEHSLLRSSHGHLAMTRAFASALISGLKPYRS